MHVPVLFPNSFFFGWYSHAGILIQHADTNLPTACMNNIKFVNENNSFDAWITCMQDLDHARLMFQCVMQYRFYKNYKFGRGLYVSGKKIQVQHNKYYVYVKYPMTVSFR